MRQEAWQRGRGGEEGFKNVILYCGKSVTLCVSVQYMVKRDGDARMDIFIFSKDFLQKASQRKEQFKL